MGFVLVAAWGTGPLALGANVAISTWLQAVLPGTLVDPASLLLVAGSNTVCFGLIAAYCGYLYGRGYGLAALAPLTLVLGLMIEVALKAWLDHPPVWDSLYRSSSWYLVPNPAGEVELPSPFPSGHSMRITFLALLAGGFVEARLRPAAARLGRVALGLLAAAGVTAVVYLGWHWATDALGGALLGYLAASASARLEALGRRGR